MKNRLAYYRAGKRDLDLELGAPRDARRDESLSAFYQTLSTPSRKLMRRERIEQLEAAFDRLPKAEREVILLSRIVGLPHEEVARATKRSVQASRSLLHRALARLSEDMESSQEPG